MAKIGRWVQSNKDDYEKYGTLLPNKNKQSDFGQALSILRNRKSQYQSLSGGKNLTHLEDFLTNLMYGEEKSKEGTIEKQFWDNVMQEFNKKYEFIGIGAYGGAYKKKITKAEGQTITAKQIHSKATNILKRLSSMNSTDDIEKIKKDLGQVIKNVESNNKRISGLNTNRKIGGGMLVTKAIEAINEGIKLASLPTPLATGDFWEMFLGRVGEWIANQAEITADNLVEKVFKKSNSRVVGGKTGDIKINTSDFGFIKNAKITPVKSQQKVDVIIDYNDEKLNVSAKNYSLKNDDQTIHLVSGTSLSTLISNENKDNFVNHWLNNIHLGGPHLNEYHKAMKTIIAGKALIGMSKNKANVMILNNRSAKKVYVKDMASIHKKIMNNLELLQIEGYPEGQYSINGNNYKERANNAFNYFHSIKINASMNKKAIII